MVNLNIALNKVSCSNLKLTKQRKSILKILFNDGHGHYTAEQIHSSVIKDGFKVSLATVYNTLKEFTKIGIIKGIKVSSDKTYFDTNSKPHHHFYHKQSGKLEDIELKKIKISEIPKVPKGRKLDSIEVVINLD
ncbi:MAG: transcriptional repressor [Rickettsiales bacterium]|nr:transcriptional repressor [Rickettsiales bacterium]|tara:strand:- start:377 stop:778 length:402 start_codon:yes stop_codon:yes gene_type:complete